LGGLVTVLSLGGFMLVMFRRDSRQETPGPEIPGPGTTGTGSGKTGTGTKVNG